MNFTRMDLGPFSGPDTIISHFIRGTGNILIRLQLEGVIEEQIYRKSANNMRLFPSMMTFSFVGNN